MKSNYKTTSTTLRVNRETNLMRHLIAWLEDGYCSITVANQQLITTIRFVSKSYTHPWKDFANRLRLVLHACEILFSKNVREKFAVYPNTAMHGRSAEQMHACRAAVRCGYGSWAERSHQASRRPGYSWTCRLGSLTIGWALFAGLVL